MSNQASVLPLIAHVFALWVSDCWTRGSIKSRRLHAKTRAVVVYDRALNDVVSGEGMKWQPEAAK